MNLLDLPDNIIDIIYNNLNTQSIINLKLSCKYLNYYSNFKIFNNIYFYNNTSQLINNDIINEITFIPYTNITSFVDLLSINPQFIQFINKIQFDSFNNNTIDNNDNIINNIKKILKICGKNVNFINFNFQIDSFISLFDNNNEINNIDNNNIHIINTNPHIHHNLIYENDQIDFIDDYDYNNNNNNYYNDIKQYPTSFNILSNLISIQLVSFDDIYLFNSFIQNNNHHQSLNLKYLEFNIKKPNSISNLTSINHNLSNLSNYPSLPSLPSQLLNNLISLKITNFQSLSIFNSYFNNNNNNIINLPNLKSLSLAISDNNYEINNLISILQNFSILSSLKSLEIKFKRTSYQNISNFNIININNNINFINKLNKIIENYSLLEEISIINLNNHNMLTDNIFKNEIFDDSNLCFALINNLNLFQNINNNNNIPSLKSLTICLNNFITLVEPVKEGINSYNKFVLTDEYLNRKQEIFNKLFNFQNLIELTIPDFLFNWLPFIKEGENINLNYQKIINESNQRKVALIIRCLYSRFINFENNSTINLNYKPIIKVNEISINSLILNSINLKIYFDLLLPIILIIAEKLPKLTYLNLGGHSVIISRYQLNGKVCKVQSVYDNWSYSSIEDQ